MLNQQNVEMMFRVLDDQLKVYEERTGKNRFEAIQVLMNQYRENGKDDLLECLTAYNNLLLEQSHSTEH